MQAFCEGIPPVPCDDNVSEPFLDEVGSFDEPLLQDRLTTIEAGTGRQPWLEITLILLVLIGGCLGGISVIASWW